MIWLSSHLTYHLIISDSVMWKRLQNVYSHIKQTRLKPLTHPIWQLPLLHPVSYQPPTHRRLLSFPVCVFIIGEDSFVMTSRQFGIHSWLQCDFHRLVRGIFLEIIMLFSSCSKDSLYPTSRSRTTMELSPHPNDIWVRSLHKNVSWQFSIPIVKDVFLTEVVIRDIRNWFFQKPPLKLINLCLKWWDSDYCLVRLIGQTHLFLKDILIRRWLPWVFPDPSPDNSTSSSSVGEVLKFLVHTSRNCLKPQFRLLTSI